ncbi:MAG: metallophosphoesterase [Nitrospirae bacterium]|nr:metallophosphoesterase [Nitrospirota bacterium]
MILFLVFYTLYGLGHLYLFLKLKYTFAIDSAAITIIVFFMLFMMTLSPFFVHLYSFKGPVNRVKTFAYIGYLWLSSLLIFCTIAFPIDVYNFLVYLTGGMLKKDLSAVIISPTKAFLVPFIHSVALNVLGYFKAKKLPLERISIKTDKLPEGINKLKILQISDLHLGIIIKGEKLNKVLNIAEQERPDIIVSTGDLLDAEINHVDYLAERIGQINAPFGKFAVTGNHEFFGGIKHALKFFEDSGFTVLRGEGITIKNIINIAGVDDPIGGQWKQAKNNITEKDMLSVLPQNIFTVLLKHRPNIDKEALGLFDLQLSGHAHKGQIFPINIVTKLIYGTHAGYAKLLKNSAIYVSRGAGTAGPPVRLFAPPEITIIEIIRKEKL